ncbi:MAG: aminodeoxychorismate synthase component I [Chloroflexota bacterium]
MNQVVLHDAAAGRWRHFRRPLTVIQANQLDEVLPSLAQVEAAVQEGLYAAGFLSYEAAPAFDPALRTRPPSSLPLLWFGLYDPADVMDSEQLSVTSNQLSVSTQSPINSSPLSSSLITHHSSFPYHLGPWQPTTGRPAYDQAIAAIKEQIANGYTYQVNYTIRLRAAFQGDPWRLFVDLAEAQQGDYAAYVDTGRFTLCSASPELFFDLDGQQLVSRPMKGTAGRGRTLAEDEARRQWLRQSEKNQAENVMIVDMIRNDLGRVARLGSVHVPALFAVEKYPTVWQMTSTVAAQTDASLTEILRALFPCASITGAPKVSTMGIIADLEQEPRGVYTGSIGFIAPGRRAQFNVAIRTVVVDKEQDQAEFGVGGGIVWDSAAEEEYQECQVKARVLTERRPGFSLLESLLWRLGKGYFLLEGHLKRLAESAAYFGYPCDVGLIRLKLERMTAGLTTDHKVRLLLAGDGAVTAEALPLPPPSSAPVRLRLAPSPVDPADPFLYHKTTHRAIYEAARAARPDGDEVLLWNERGEVTEATAANVVVELGGVLLTPPVECGLLAGVYREWLLNQGIIREGRVALADLAHGANVHLINSVRGWRPAVLV